MYNDVTVTIIMSDMLPMNEEPGTIAAAIHISYEFLSELCGFSPLFSCVSNVQTRDYAVFRSIRSCFANIYLALSTAPDQKAYRASCTVPDLSSDQHFAPSFLWENRPSFSCNCLCRPAEKVSKYDQIYRAQLQKQYFVIWYCQHCRYEPSLYLCFL